MASQMHRLVMRMGPTPGKMFALSKNEVYIGRDITNDIVINDAEVSRKHARLTLQTGGYMLEDLGSTNGTFVNGQRLTGRHMLNSGDKIMLADNVTLLYEAVPTDPDATVAISPEEMIPQAPLPYATGSGSEMPSTEESARATGELRPPAEARRKNQTQLWLLSGCGCLLLIACVALTGIGWWIDTNNLWCSLPFIGDLLPGCL